MAYTATKVNLTNGDGFPRSYTCAVGTTILKNKFLTLSDPNTATEVTATPTAGGLPCAGISSMDKEADDASTTISAWTDGVFKAYCSGAIVVGTPVMSCGFGAIAQALTTSSGAYICGYALETGADGETIKFRLRV